MSSTLTSPSSSSPSASPSVSASSISDPNPKSDHRILAVVIILGVVGAFLLYYIVHITLQVKRRQAMEAESTGPYQGTLIHSDDHPAAHITPFGSVAGGSGPRFKHKPGEDMRIALRRPDGAWHFTDSRTPFTPVGVNDLDVAPSPISSATSLISFNSRFPPAVSSLQKSNKAHNVNSSMSTSASRLGSAYDHTIPPLQPPDPVYHRHGEPCRDHFDDGHSDF
ncbi:hypothetical protein CPB84DRAFT_1762612 [Gymnopilus junonius]|uniref:Uncharacterized protein n=1 Tax=Gymnopilus junonius TaxID=109634 RepID=A0A9P5TTZ8_GYMJU|nr:hypothetical protein CPB84DRAFT_1762612 [Gymnopilus junonius]